MSIFTLAISCLTTSNLPWFKMLTFQVPMQYCSLQRQTLLPSPVTSTTGCCFCPGSASSLSRAVSPLFSSSILGTYWPGHFIFQRHIFLLFYTVHGVLEVRMLKWFAIPFSCEPHFVRTLHHDPSVLNGLAWHGFLNGMAHSFRSTVSLTTVKLDHNEYHWIWQGRMDINSYTEFPKTWYISNDRCDSFFIFIRAHFLYSVALMSAIQPSESAICINISPGFWISFPFRSLQSPE